MAVRRFRLLSRCAASADSWLLRFALPPGWSTPPGAAQIPTGIKVLHHSVEKSYSPVSHPAHQTLDLLVKHYSPRPNGGVSDTLCSLRVGEEVEVKVKPSRTIHGSPSVSRRWKRLGLLSCGTGIAPFVQILRILRNDEEDRTQVWLLNFNRSPDDILLKAELDELAAGWPGGRLRVTYSLTGPNPPTDWQGALGRGSVDMAREALPPNRAEGGDTMILVCGTDAFVEDWAGLRRQKLKDAVGRVIKSPGPFGGLLAKTGYRECEVYKY